MSDLETVDIMSITGRSMMPFIKPNARDMGMLGARSESLSFENSMHSAEVLWSSCSMLIASSRLRSLSAENGTAARTMSTVPLDWATV